MPPTEPQRGAETWQVLQFSDALDLEFASVLADLVPVNLWKPVSRMPWLSGLPAATAEQSVPGSHVKLCSFPRMRGLARLPLGLLTLTGGSLAARLGSHEARPQQSVLVCTTPFFAPVAERWPGPVVYWLTDLIARYGGASYSKVRKLDERMCRAATLVCPNSEKIAAYLTGEAGCPPAKCHVLPNATGLRSLLPEPLLQPSALPAPYADLPRPLAGVIGNLAENTDWLFLQSLQRQTPWLHWLFVGPYAMHIRSRRQRRARDWVLHHERTCLAGQQPYTELYKFARGVDVAVLPYRMREPTFSGSSTRFYDHLAACHPIVATNAVHALRSEEPLLRLVDGANAAAQVLEALRASDFQDGLRRLRWETSLRQTWLHRARTMVELLQVRLSRGQ